MVRATFSSGFCGRRGRLDCKHRRFTAIGFDGVHGLEPYKFKGLDGIHGPNQFTGLGAIPGPKSCRFIGFGGVRGPKLNRFTLFCGLHGPGIPRSRVYPGPRVSPVGRGRVLDFLGFFCVCWSFSLSSRPAFQPPGPILRSAFLWRCFCRHKPPCVPGSRVLPGPGCVRVPDITTILYKNNGANDLFQFEDLLGCIGSSVAGAR